jgi:hypothetical protein
VELAAGGDAELGEDLAQVVLNGVGADEQPGADLRVGQPVPGQQRDLHFLRRQLLAGLDGSRPGALAGGLPGGLQLPAGPFGEGFHPDLVEHAVRGAQLLPGVGPAVFAAQPLAVEQVRAGQLGAKPGAAEPVDRVGVQVIGGPVLGGPVLGGPVLGGPVLGGTALGQQCAGPRLDPSPQSVPPAWVVSDSRATASPAMDIFPLRTAASTSSASAHMHT